MIFIWNSDSAATIDVSMAATVLLQCYVI